MTDRIPVGSVHGRFQPLHNAHLDYIRAGLERAEFLYIGLTQFRVKSLVDVNDPTALHRNVPSANPLTYLERATIVRDVLLSEGYDLQQFVVTPFPIESPTELPDFVPLDAVAFTTKVEPWNDSKIDVLSRAGYHVEVLWTRPKAIAGSSIRERIATGDDSWRSEVPEVVARRLEQWEIGERLRLRG